MQYYFPVPKNDRKLTLKPTLHTTYFILKIPNKKELHQIAINHSSDIDFKDFMNLQKIVLQNHILS